MYIFPLNRTYSRSTKCHYPVSLGDVQKECRKFLIQIIDSEGINIQKGVVGKYQVHIYIVYGPSQNISRIVKK
ncbi:transposase [Confluentibacter sediminis]|uniref:transposase n=1 Tax=Confluentibacter sediminis TaxID=2219045 RepID=UPI000DAD34C9